MRFPIFGFCEGDLYVFSNKVEACREIEPADAKASSWQLYDRNGQRLTIAIVRRPLWRWSIFTWLTIERIELLETGELDQTGMEASLSAALGAIAMHDVSVSKQLTTRVRFEELAEEAIRAFT